MNKKKKIALLILDGWGIGSRDKTDAIAKAETPFMNALIEKFPNARLRTDGENVGLPNGQMGNSEVGHMNIGAGRIVYQDFVKIDHSINTGEFFKNEILCQAFDYAKANDSRVHFLGLVSNGGVHSHINHLKALCNMAVEKKLTSVFIHAITDGRDTDPNSGKVFLEEIEKFIANTTIKMASVVGRYFAMDRDKRWERVKKAYDLFVHGVGEKFKSSREAIEHSYEKKVTDEFVEPSIIVDENNAPLASIENGDVVICFNFRTDRCREITQVLTQKEFVEWNMKPLKLHYLTMTNYDNTFENVKVLFDKDNLNMTLGQVVSGVGLTQLRIAETEKYPHVSFFFSGGREKEFIGEKRIMIPSPKVATYDLQPEMSAAEVANAACNEMRTNSPDFIVLNFANPDMVGHTGVFSAIVKAVETTDRCLKQVVETGRELGYSFLIIADHGNADCAVNPDGTPNTAHTTNPVPLIIIDTDVEHAEDGILADIAPTILRMFGIKSPKEMTGKILVS